MKNAILEVSQVYKSFGLHEALRGVSLTLYAGEVVSLLGVNGAGKTTLSAIMAALLPPTGGDVRYRGVSIYEDVSAYRMHVGYCPQHVALLHYGTVYDHLWWTGAAFGFSRDIIEERIELLADQYTLHAVLRRDPDTLSGGYRRRLSLARSVFHNPSIIVLDEPTVALDPHIRRQVWEHICMLRDTGKSVVLTTHYLDEAEYVSDQVHVLEKGIIIKSGSPRDLIAAAGKKRLEEVFLSMIDEEMCI